MLRPAAERPFAPPTDAPAPASTAAASPHWRPVQLPTAGQRVAVALSGGVDSAVAALRLVQRGCDVVGVTTRNFCYGDTAAAAGERSCCTLQAIEAARELCADLGIPHVVLDVAELFQAAVIDDFVGEYRAGRTPNPCVRCNERVRFPQLWSWARRQGCTRLATGHYARLVHDAAGASYVARGLDAAKDQSYFLYRVDPRLLAQLAFPVGDSSKSQVRAEARAHRLPVADTPESQEVCFVPAAGRALLVGDGAGPGEIVDQAGRVVGTHDGLTHFTVGQRRGLGVGGGAPLYVTRLDAERNRVEVGPDSALLRQELWCDEAYLRDPVPTAEGLRARTRYRHPGLAVRAVEWHEDRLRVVLDAPDRAPAPGQMVVLDRDGVVVGGGRLREEACAS